MKLASVLAIVVILAIAPYRWSHHLTAACTWRPADLIGTRYAADRAAQASCWARRGLKSPEGVPLSIGAKWPS